MKTYAFILALAVGATACQQTSAPTSETVAVEAVATNQASFTIEGMVCEVGCKGTIEKKLGKTPGVTACTIDFESGNATVAYDAAVVSSQDIKAVVEGISQGQYTVSDLTETAL